MCFQLDFFLGICRYDGFAENGFLFWLVKSNMKRTLRSPRLFVVFSKKLYLTDVSGQCFYKCFSMVVFSVLILDYLLAVYKVVRSIVVYSRSRGVLA